jgi:hypothetical protein
MSGGKVCMHSVLLQGQLHWQTVLLGNSCYIVPVGDSFFRIWHCLIMTSFFVHYLEITMQVISDEVVMFQSFCHVWWEGMYAVVS